MQDGVSHIYVTQMQSEYTIAVIAHVSELGCASALLMSEGEGALHCQALLTNMWKKLFSLWHLS